MFSIVRTICWPAQNRYDVRYKTLWISVEGISCWKIQYSLPKISITESKWLTSISVLVEFLRLLLNTRDVWTLKKIIRIPLQSDIMLSTKCFPCFFSEIAPIACKLIASTIFQYFVLLNMKFSHLALNDIFCTTPCNRAALWCGFKHGNGIVLQFFLYPDSTTRPWILILGYWS